MDWQVILKRGSRAISQRDIDTIRYVMRDGKFRTLAAIMDEIFELIEDTRKRGYHRVLEREGSEAAVRSFSASRKMVQTQLSKREYESRDTGNKTPSRQPILEYRYIGV